MNLLNIWLLSAGHNVIQHTNDVDVDQVLVDKVLELGKRDNVIAHANDSYFLVLLISKLPITPNHSVYLKLDKSNKTANLHH